MIGFRLFAFSLRIQPVLMVLLSSYFYLCSILFAARSGVVFWFVFYCFLYLWTRRAFCLFFRSCYVALFYVCHPCLDGCVCTGLQVSMYEQSIQIEKVKSATSFPGNLVISIDKYLQVVQVSRKL